MTGPAHSFSIEASHQNLKSGSPFALHSLEPPAKLGISKPSKGLKGPARESFGVKQEWSATAFPSSWIVDGQELELVPTEFPLERTHREISEDASIVASRISETLRLLSIQTEFDCKKAKAKCTTSDCVNFRIRLYAGGEDGKPVVVEVQRRCGSASSFMRSCRAILDAAEGESTRSDTKMKAPNQMKAIGDLKCLEKARPSDEEAKIEVKSSLDVAVEMLRSSRHDLTLMGLENMCYLTDPLKTLPQCALRISRDIIMENNMFDLREEIRVLIERDHFRNGLDSDEGPVNHDEHLRQLALRVFSNAMALCSKDGCLIVAVNEQKWFGDTLIPTLIDELKRATVSANSAYEAAICVLSLVSCSGLALQVLVENGIVPALESAYEFGTLRHELLAEEALRCLEVIKITANPEK